MKTRRADTHHQDWISSCLYAEWSRKGNRTQLIGRVIERNESLFPVIAIDVLDRNSQPRRIYAVIDTGFTGEILLPPRIIQMIKTELHDDIIVEITDGNILSTSTYLGTISWHATHRRVRIIEADGYSLAAHTVIPA